MTIHKVGNKSGKSLRSGLIVGSRIIAPSSNVIQTPQTAKLKTALGRNVKSSIPAIIWPTGNPDPHKDNVVLYLTCDGVNDGTYFQDFSPNPKIVGNSGSPVTKTAIKKYGASSLYLNGSSHLFLSNTADWRFGTGEFTIEFWSYGLSAPSSDFGMVISAAPSAGATTAGWIAVVRPSNSRFDFFASTGSGGFDVFSGNSGSLTPALSDNSWAHCAWVRSGNNMLFFHNGILKNTVAFTSNTMPNPAQALNIGVATNGTSFPLVGYLDSIRITKDVARYTADFNPETDTYLAYG